MIVHSLKVRKLYGYMNFDLEFHSDLNFLIGINGSGKTSVLNVIAWMLTPSLLKLTQLDFEEIQLVSSDENNKRTIEARRKSRAVVLSIEGISKSLEIPIFEYPEAASQERTTTTIQEMYERFRVENRNHPALVELDSMGPPLYLPLDRRWEVPDRMAERDIRWARSLQLARYRTRGRTGGAIESVLYLAERYYRERQFKVGQLGEKLRENLVEDIFGDVLLIGDLKIGKKMWSVSEVTRRRDTILAGLSQAEIHVSEDVVNRLFDALEKMAKAGEKEPYSKKKLQPVYVEWAMNLPQVEKIERVIARMEAYNRERVELLRTIEDFTSTVNSFLCDTGKLIRFDPSGEIAVQIDGAHEIRAESLSSGEAQLVILFAYLYFGFQPKKKFTVMIDEPELSLHLEWQHRYVDSVTKANPDAQFIFATHAPEIGQGRGDRCIDLSGRGRKEC